jgi:hypothetical protein
MALSQTYNPPDWRLLPHQLELLKYLALVFMLLDHINTIIFNREIDWLFTAGRMAFPLFCFVAAYNYEYHARHASAWLRRLVLFALLTQPIYMWAFNDWQGNIFFTLLLGLSLVLVFDRLIGRDSPHKKSGKSYVLLGLYFVAVMGCAALVNYFQAGILAIPLLVAWLRTRRDGILFLVLVNFIVANIFLYEGLFAVLALGLVFMSVWLDWRVPRLPRWFYYWFYPAHLVILKLIFLYYPL